MVNYGTRRFPIEMNDDAIFKALADRSRRKLLDRLRQRNGQTLGELCNDLDMTRQAVAKHLRVLKKGNLVSWRRDGRERLHFINPVPIAEIAERWISKFEHPRVRALANLKKNLEGDES
jgi:DNA-binding transcriptional ArsR family regulator